MSPAQGQPPTVRIAIDYTSALNQRAGIGRFTRQLVDALLEQDRRHDYLLLGPRRSRFSPSPAALSQARLARWPLTEWGMTVLWHRLGLRIPAEAFAGPFDLFHGPDFVLPPMRCRRSILTVHDLSFLVYPEHAVPTLARYLRRVVPPSVARASLVVADSESTRHDLIRHLGAPPDKVAVVWGGVDPSFRPITDQVTLARVRQRYQAEPPFVLSVGTLEPRKNYGRLLEAFAALRRELSQPIRLLIAGGKGWLYDDIFRQQRSLGLDEAVAFLGFVPEDDLPALISLAQVFVYPSLYEGFGLPVLEAMACGAPVIAANTSALPEVAQGAALLVDPSDVAALAGAMRRVLEDEGLRQELSERGQERAATFTWERAAAQMLTLYQKVLEAAPSDKAG